MSIHRHACCVCGCESKLQEGFQVATHLVSLCYCEHHREYVQEVAALARIGLDALRGVVRENQNRLSADALHLAVDRNLRAVTDD